MGAEIITSTMPPTIKAWSWSGHTFETDDIVGYSSVRSVENPVAQARILLKGDRFRRATGSKVVGQRYDEIFQLYDLVQIRIRDRSGQEWVDMLGLVHSTEQDAKDNNEYPSTDFALEIRSIGEYLVQYQVWNHSDLPIPALSRFSYFARTGDQPVKGRPDQVIQRFFDLYVSDRLAIKSANGKGLSDLFALDLYKTTDGATTINFSGVGQEDSLWDTLRGYADLPFNLFWTDVPVKDVLPSTSRQKRTPYGSREKIYLRKAPFTQQEWSKRRGEESYIYDGSDRLEDGESLRKSADNVANFVWVAGRPMFGQPNQLSDLYLQSNKRIPVLSETSIRRFNIRRMSAKTEYVQFLGSDPPPLTGAQKRNRNTQYNYDWEMLEARARELFEFFGYPDHLAGTLELAGRIGPSSLVGARIGGILVHKPRGLEFFISQINQDWSMGSGGLWETSLSLQHGHNPVALAKWQKQQAKQNQTINVRPQRKAKSKPDPNAQGRPQEVQFEAAVQQQRNAMIALLTNSLQHPAPSNVSKGIGIGVDYGYTEFPRRNKRFRFHRGIDINDLLDTDLLAVGDGTVVLSGQYLTDYGQTVIIEHTTTAGPFWSVYAHCNSIAVTVGQKVTRGQSIAKMGKTGNTVKSKTDPNYGVHLHFEIRLLKNERATVVDPIPLLSGLEMGNGQIFFSDPILRTRQAPY